MSSGTAIPPQSQESPGARPTECELAIERQIVQTQRNVKGVDIASGLITLAIGVLAYLLAAVAIDHWLVLGGLGFWGRLWLWLVLVAAAGTYFVRRLLPPLRNRINPLFAAAAIEQSQPSLKNSLINLLLLRGRRREVAPIVYQAMERQAVADLASVETDAAVDREHVIHLGYVLAVVVAIFTLYLVLSPKNPIRSASRVLWPWASIEAPTRVTIREIEPGDTVAFLGDSVTISAEVAGLADGEPALVVYSTGDGQTVDQSVPLTCAQGDYRYQCQLPPDSLGIQQDLIYYLAAGDCRTRRYRIEAQIAPAIVVDKITYRYPAYTGIADRTVENQGDVQAIEGTEVTIEATANGDIKPGTAEIDLGCTLRPGRRMTTEGRTAVGRFTLQPDPQNAAAAEYDAYQLRFTDMRGRENRRPIRHRIDMIRDLPPEVKLVEPQQAEVRLPVNGRLPIKVWAEDPDFALRRVTLRAECDNKSLPIAPLLDERNADRASTRNFSGDYSFEPARLHLKAGDVVEYWAEAEDNKTPTPGQTATAKQRIVIVGADRQKAASEDRSDEKTSGDQADGSPSADGRDGDAAKGTTGDKDKTQADGQRSDDQTPQPNEERPDQNREPSESSQSEQGDAGKPEEQEAQKRDGRSSEDQQPSSQSSEENKIDPETAPGDAMQEILNDRQKQEQQEQQEQQESKQQKQQGDQSSGAGKSAQSGDSSSKQQPSDDKAGDKADQPQGEQKKSGDQQGGEPKTGSQDRAQKPSADQQNGENQDRKTSQPSEERTQKPGDDQQGDKRDQKASQQDKNGKSADERQPSGEDRQANQKPDDKQGNEGQAGGEETDGQQGGEASESTSDKGGEAKGHQESGGQNGGDRSEGESKTGQQSSDEQNGEKGSNGERRGEKGDQGDKSGSASGDDEQQPTSEKPSAAKENADRTPSDGTSSSETESKTADNAGEPTAKDAAASKQTSPRETTDAAAERTDAERPDSSVTPSGKRSGDDAQADGQKSTQPEGDNASGQASGRDGKAPADQSANGKRAGQKATADKPTDQKAEGSDRTGQKSTSGEPTDQEAKGGDRSGQKSTGGEPTDQKAEGGDRSRQKSTGGEPTDEKDDQKAEAGDRAGQKAASDGRPGEPAEGRPEGPLGKGAPDAKDGGKSTVPTGGGKPGSNADDATTPESSEDSADRANLEYARRQTELALEHLREQLAKEKPPLLERLGWTKDDARRFLDRWESMRRAAAAKGPEAEAAQNRLNNALRSLGLRPHGVELRHGGLSPDEPQNLRDMGRFAPPPDWADQFREYTRGVAGEEEPKGK